MRPIAFYQSEFITFLRQQQFPDSPQKLYEPISYILELGGKRMRPVLTLMAAELFGYGHEKALPAAMAIEVFHNFSLIHDDIMDDAPLRRGEPTVHKKWNLNTGILSGDAMLIVSYQYLQQYSGAMLEDVFRLFNKTAIEVCEGQQFDIDFETRNDVTITEYLKMIEYKTSVLVGAALQMGAIVARSPEKDQRAIYEFGRNLGIAFQLQDDYLDAFGNPETFGKQVGGDIIENKKTYLYLKALELAPDDDRLALVNFFSEYKGGNDEKVKAVKAIFKGCGAIAAIKEEIGSYTDKALKALGRIDAHTDGKELFRQFAVQLMDREV